MFDMFEFTENGIKVAIDPMLMDNLWKGFLSWGWMAATGVVMLGTIVRMMGFRIKKARTYMKEHPGSWGKLAYTFTLVSIISSSVFFGVSTLVKMKDANHAARATAKSQDLPGVWTVLYDQLNELSHTEARFFAIEAFAGAADVGEMPRLPYEGFIRIIEQASNGHGHDESAKTILTRLGEVMKPFIQISE